MLKFLKTLLITIAVILVILIVIPLSLAFYVSTDKGQQKVKDYVINTLSKELDTQIKLDRISVREDHIGLYGFAINDKKGVKMLNIDTAEVSLSFREILSKRIVLKQAVLSGAEGVFYKERKDTLPNYQFLVDWMKSTKTEKKEKKGPGFTLVTDLKNTEVKRTSLKWDVLSEEKNENNKKIDPNHIFINNLQAEIDADVVGDTVITRAEVFNFAVEEQNSGTKFRFKKLELTHDYEKTDSVKLVFAGVYGFYNDNYIDMKELDVVSTKADIMQKQNIDVAISDLFVHTDNHKPRINKIKPRRGFFDAGHLDTNINLNLTIKSIRHDTIEATLTHLDALDKVSKLNIRKMTADIAHNKENTTITSLNISLPQSKISLPQCSIRHIGKDIFIHDFRISGDVVLRDISHPFAPLLRDFTTPVKFRAVVGGPIDEIHFKDIFANTHDNKLKVNGEGRMDKVTKGKALTLDFYNIRMTAVDGIKERLVQHFGKGVRLKMMPQLQAIGDISFQGSLGVKYKWVQMQGKVHCKYAELAFNCHVDGKAKQLHGKAQVDSLNLGAILGVKSLKSLHIGHTTANFHISTALRTKQSNYTNKHKGRLPIGTLTAEVDKASYGLLKVKKIDADIKSDGVVATGNVKAINSLVDLDMDFEFKQTDNERTFKTKPKLKVHKSEKKKAKEAAKAKEEVKEETADQEPTKEKKKRKKFLGIF